MSISRCFCILYIITRNSRNVNLINQTQIEQFLLKQINRVQEQTNLHYLFVAGPGYSVHNG